MDKGNLNISHLAWCALVALHTARQDGQANSPAQDNLFLTRWFALAEKQRRFTRELASDISWLLREGREKGLRADLPGKLEYLWRAGNGSLLDQNDLFRLQHALHAVKMSGWIYMVLAGSEWCGRRQLRLSSSVSGVYLCRSALDNGFNENGQQIIPLSARLTGDLPALDAILKRSGWRRVPVKGEDALLHQLLAIDFNDA
ncbi:hypothetical protein PRCB_17680 [Pantoea rodasii]|uniref:DUF2913 domain-containing protein n=1 Tax=Pantoea rodasii TaxID=1076549 RepID=A0A2M9W985_9GAMM|nr:DUF2913 family protein [Pantoea rodasii]ORM63991.1 hypothetical protein HA45_12825 [Pantoea rodasii]PJZ04106.1 hypothetical protein PRCB_17680 [Pantoea rodasii]